MLACIGAAMLLIVLPRTSYAQSHVDLQLDAPSGCPSQAAILSAVNRLVQSSPKVTLNAKARLAPEGDHWTLELAFDQGQRRVVGDTCVAVAEALVVILALAVDPNAQLNVATFRELELSTDGSPANSNAQVPTTAPAVANSTNLPGPNPRAHRDPGGGWTTSDPEDSATNQQKYPTRFGLSVMMLTDSGTLPSLSLGPSMIGRYGSHRYWGEVSVNWLLPRWARSTQDLNKGGNISWFSGQFAGCWVPRVSLPLGGCLGAELGDLIGKGDGIATRRTAFALWLAATANVVLRAELRRDFGFEARLGLAVPALRPEFGLQGYGAFFQPDWVSLRANLGISWR
jgi:hypothetical protein